MFTGKRVTYLKGQKAAVKRFLRNVPDFFKHKNRTYVCPQHVFLGVATPMAFFHFGGFRDSFLGDLLAQDRDALEFFTDAVVVVERWY